jgi:glycosyltransferase 2 family protein
MKITRTHMVTALKVVISCAFFAILLSFVQGNELLKMAARIEWLYLSLSFLLIPVMLTTSCLKWKVILGSRGKEVSFFELLRIYTVGYFFSNLLPSTVGGDMIRSYYSGRLLDNQAFAAVSIFVERFTGIFLLFFLVIFAPLFSPGLYASPYIYVPACAGFFLVTLTVWMWKVENPLALPEKILGLTFSTLHRLTSPKSFSVFRKGVIALEKGCHRILNRLGTVRKEFLFAAETLRGDRIYLAKVLFLTVLFYVLTWVNVYLSFRAFGVHPDFLGVCALVPAILFAAHVPVTLLGNLGYFESVFVFYFLLIGIPGAETLAMGLLLRAKMLTIGLVGFFMYLFYTYKPRDEFSDLKEFVKK